MPSLGLPLGTSEPEECGGAISVTPPVSSFGCEGAKDAFGGCQCAKCAHPNCRSIMMFEFTTFGVFDIRWRTSACRTSCSKCGPECVSAESRFGPVGRRLRQVTRSSALAAEGPRGAPRPRSGHITDCPRLRVWSCKQRKHGLAFFMIEHFYAVRFSQECSSLKIQEVFALSCRSQTFEGQL